MNEPLSTIQSFLKVEIWDLKSAEKIVQLPSSNPINSSSVSNRGRDLFWVYIEVQLYHQFFKILISQDTRCFHDAYIFFSISTPPFF